MSSISAKEVFNNLKCINNSDFENSKNITLDFSNIENMDLHAITSLLNIQKVAILNNKSLSLENVNPNVEQVLDVIGLKSKMTNPISEK